jgi:hypothetical protein
MFRQGVFFAFSRPRGLGEDLSLRTSEPFGASEDAIFDFGINKLRWGCYGRTVRREVVRRGWMQVVVSRKNIESNERDSHNLRGGTNGWEGREGNGPNMID